MCVGKWYEECTNILIKSVYVWHDHCWRIQDATMYYYERTYPLHKEEAHGKRSALHERLTSIFRSRSWQQIMLSSFKLSDYCSFIVTMWLVPCPDGFWHSREQYVTHRHRLQYFVLLRSRSTILSGILHCGLNQRDIFEICFTSSYFSSKQEQGMWCRKNLTTVWSSARNFVLRRQILIESSSSSGRNSSRELVLVWMLRKILLRIAMSGRVMM